MEEGKYYKKIVEYKRNKEPKIFTYFAIWLFGFSSGWFARIMSPDPHDLFTIIILTGVSILLFIVDYFILHDRKVKYECYETKKERRLSKHKRGKQ